MKRQVIAIALGSLVALPAFANNEIDAGYAPQAQAAAQRGYEVFVNAEQGYERAATTAAGKSRDEVVNEAVQARRSGNFILNAELGTTASQL
jgi:hypothetical protein